MATRKIWMAVVFLLFALTSIAQTASPQVQPSTGGYLTGGNLQLQYTIGEPLISTFKAGGNEFSLGFEQPEINIVVGSIATVPHCPGSQIKIPFTTKGIFGTGNIFTAQLSDSSGSFASAVNIGYDTINHSDTVKATIPLTITGGTHYRIRVVASAPVFTGGMSSFVTVHALPDSLTPTQQDTVVCPGSTSNINIPTSQLGVRYDLMVNTVVVASGYGTDSTLGISTGAIDTNTTFHVVATDTASGCNTVLIPYITLYTYKVGIPIKAVPQTVLSDTAYTFTFSNVTAGPGGNQIVWALDSNFTSPHIDTSPTTIVITVHPNSDTLIWLKSRDSISGCTSYTILTIAQVDTMPTSTVINDTMQATCTGTTTVVVVSSSQTNVLYKLRIASAVTDSSLGNDSLLFLNTGIIDSNSVYNIIGIDTFTHSIVYSDSNIYILAIGAVDTPIFISGDTLIYKYDTAWANYTALANNSTQTIYRIVSGSGAKIDSVTGQIDSLTGGSFIVRAIAYGMPGCDTTYADLHITITSITALVPPPPIHMTVDSPQLVSITFDTIYAGTGGDQIEWDFKPDFTTSTIVASPAVISFYLNTGTDTIIYLRSKDSKSGSVSRTEKSEASARLTLLSAGLMDKTNWKLNFNDEFVYTDRYYYSYQPTPNFNFPNIWAPNFCWSGGSCDPSPFDCGDDWNGFAYNNYDGKELQFNKGVGTFTGTKFPSRVITYCNGYDTSYYHSANISTRYFMLDPSVPSITEIRCQTSSATGSHPTFWPFGGGNEFDIMENNVGDGTQLYKTTSCLHDFSTTAHTLWPSNWNSAEGNIGCQGIFYKQTPCNYSEDWHTYSMANIPGKEIMFFVDGKETWSNNLAVANPFPTNVTSSNTSRILLGLGIDGGTTADNLSFAVDYVRCYNYPAGDPPLPLQNLQGGVAKTLETPSGSAGANNIPLYFGLQHWNTSSEVAVSKISAIDNALGNPALFYMGFYGNCFKAYPTGNPNSWIEQPIISYTIMSDPFFPRIHYIQSTDVKGCLTAVNPYLVYYQSTTNQLKYLQYSNGTWSNYHAVSTNPYGTFGPGPIQNCAGSINVSTVNTVCYRGTDNNLYYYFTSSGSLLGATSDHNVAGAMVASANTMLAFYTDANHHLWQYSFCLHAYQIQLDNTGSTGNVSDYLALDETNSRIFFIGLDGNIYYYTYNLQNLLPHNLTQLGNAALYDGNNNQSLCSSSANAICGLTLSYDKNNTPGHSGQIEVYYKGIDGNLWYYFNDNENTTDIDPNYPGRQISAANWNKAFITCGSVGIGNFIAAEPSSTGKIFYTGPSQAGNVLYFSDWVNADNSITCPIAGGTATYQLRMDTVTGALDSSAQVPMLQFNSDTADKISISIFPNPSESSFAFNLNNLNTNATFDLKIEDAEGRPVYQTKGATVGNSYQLVWNAGNLTGGVYLYRLRLGNKNYMGKLVKI